jgi:hypothetical protein
MQEQQQRCERTQATDDEGPAQRKPQPGQDRHRVVRQERVLQRAMKRQRMHERSESFGVHEARHQCGVDRQVTPRHARGMQAIGAWQKIVRVLEPPEQPHPRHTDDP